MREKPLEELLAVAAEMRSSAKKAKVKTDEAKPSDDAQSNDEFPAKSQVNALSEDEDAVLGCCHDAACRAPI
jgi:hypothetical protein